MVRPGDLVSRLDQVIHWPDYARSRIHSVQDLRHPDGQPCYYCGRNAARQIVRELQQPGTVGL